ncbi:MAG: hypothetical protein EZS28_007540, partial [Streblomastix strix]
MRYGLIHYVLGEYNNQEDAGYSGGEDELGEGDEVKVVNGMMLLKRLKMQKKNAEEIFNIIT